MTTTIILLNVPTPTVRPDSLRARLGRALHPAAITDAWYAADCPPELHPRRLGAPRRTVLCWRLACWLRGAS